MPRRKRKTIVCENCGVGFLFIGNGEIYCSRKCYYDAKNANGLDKLSSGVKKCSRCLEDKKIEEFSITKVRKRPIAACKSCIAERTRIWSRQNRERKKTARLEWFAKNPDRYNAMMKKWRENNKPKKREIMLKKKYGINLEDYDRMLSGQDGVCAICKTHNGRTLHVDHCHTSGNVRGLLCDGCNQALGLMRDNPITLESGAEYLRARQ